ncbi:MAG: hypothetical protein KH704_12390 [Clostridiales bacterium]|nr:hypothetical protein [Clostridiales bacterium]
MKRFLRAAASLAVVLGCLTTAGMALEFPDWEIHGTATMDDAYAENYVILAEETFTMTARMKPDPSAPLSTQAAHFSVFCDCKQSAQQLPYRKA